jgi:hypothetical protein
MDSVVWIFTGLQNIDMVGQQEIKLTDRLALHKPNGLLLSCRDRNALGGRDFQQMESVSCFLLLRENGSPLRTPEREKYVSRLQNALMAFQIIKPISTYGFIFQAIQHVPAALNLERIERRLPMDPGLWAKRRTFDEALLSQVPGTIARVQNVMDGNDIRKKNAIYLFQLALEHYHPYVAALLAVAGMEAIFDCWGRKEFKQRLCNCLGASAHAFPDWNPPEVSPKRFTVERLAVPLYTLRSKIAHGADLREAANDKSAPVDLLELVDLRSDFGKPTYAMLLCESSIYLLAQVLKKVL